MNKIFSFLIIISLSVQAQAPKEKVKELIKEMQADKMITQMMDQMIPAMQQQISTTLKTEQQKQKLKEINTILHEEAKSFTINMINGPMVDIYAKHFTEEDVDYLIDFYKSETGKKLIELTPIITTELMQTMMQKGIPEFQEKIKDRIQSIQSK